MNKKVILNFLNIVFSAANVERVCISPKIHKFCKMYRDYPKYCKKDYPCCTKICEMTEEIPNTASSVDENEKIKEVYDNCNCLENGKNISVKEIELLLNFEIKDSKNYYLYPRENATYAMDVLEIMRIIIKLMHNYILLNNVEKELEKFSFTFSENVYETRTVFDGTVVDLLNKLDDQILDTCEQFLILVTVKNRSKRIRDNTEYYLSDCGYYTRDVIANIIRQGLCQQNKDLIFLLEKFISYFDYFIDDYVNIYKDDNSGDFNESSESE